MRLSQFILGNLEEILGEWEEFARSLPVGQSMTPLALRNDAERMLRFIAADIETAQTDNDQQLKSQGRAAVSSDPDESAAHDHGTHRLEEGFSLNDLIAEYRAIRATVLRLWVRKNEHIEQSREVLELIRFNEAVDQSIAESVVRYTGKLDRARDILLAMLGHDLRNPLSSIAMSSQLLLMRGGLDQAQRQSAQRIAHSADRTLLMVSDLLDFTRTRLGTRLPIEPAPCDLAAACSQAVEELRGAHPAHRFTVSVTGNLQGEWDCARITQLLSNLIANAVQHGDPKTPVEVTLDGRADDVQLTVHNLGPVISEAETRTIFDPLVRTHRTGPERSGNLGLGLYIARQIALAHGGQINVRSSDESGTCFAVVLPRAKPAE